MRDRLDVGDDSGYAGYIFFMVALGLPVALVTIFAAVGVILTN